MYDQKYLNFMDLSAYRASFQLAMAYVPRLYRLPSHSSYFCDANPAVGTSLANLTGNEIVFVDDAADNNNALRFMLLGYALFQAIRSRVEIT